MDWLNFLQIIAIVLIHILSWVTVIHALLHKHNPRSALGWTVAALFLPLIGSILYFTFGIGRAESRAAKLMRQAKLSAAEHHAYLHGGTRHDRPPGHVNTKFLHKKFHPFARIGLQLTKRTLSGGNTVAPLFNGDEAYPQMLEAIANAQKHVYLTTYIFNDGDAATSFCTELQAAAARGVDVRVIVDGLGAKLYSFSWPWKKLQAHGVHVAQFLPPRFYPPNFAINLRNHRKVLVADGVGFTGGMNISDNHIKGNAKFNVQDVHFRCRGPIVAQLREAFLLDWGFCTNDYNTINHSEEYMCGDIICRMVLDGPGSGHDPLHELIYGVMGAASKSIRLMTPYFLPTHEVVGALKAAATRGIDVRIILPAKNNLFFVHWACMHLLPTLLESGVRIFYQPAPFAHTKLLMVDGHYAQIGSANLDARSLRLNFELNVECFDQAFTKQMEAYFDTVEQKSSEYTIENHEQLKMPLRLRNAACWLFSPYL